MLNNEPTHLLPHLIEMAMQFVQMVVMHDWVFVYLIFANLLLDDPYPVFDTARIFVAFQLTYQVMDFVLQNHRPRIEMHLLLSAYVIMKLILQSHCLLVRGIVLVV